MIDKLRSHREGLRSQKGFTLIELLVVIAIIAILVLIVIVVINPAERLNQARDSAASSDVRSTALGVAACITKELGANTGKEYLDVAGCGEAAYLKGTPQSYLQNVPNGVTITTDNPGAVGTKDCIYKEGRSGKYASWNSTTGSETAAPDGSNTCT